MNARHGRTSAALLAGLSGVLLTLTCATPAFADAFRTPLLKAGVPTSIQAYGRQNPACLEWTNGCILCTSSGGHAQCSTPGIACTPAGITCKRLQPPPEPAKP